MRDPVRSLIGIIPKYSLPIISNYSYAVFMIAQSLLSD